MAKRERPDRRQPTKGRLFREVTYLHEDEQTAVEQAAQRLRCSRSEVIRRAVRAWFEIED